MKTITIKLLLVICLTITLKSQNCINNDIITISHNEAFSCFLESYIKGKSNSMIKKDIVIFCKENNYLFDSTQVAFIFYKYYERYMCDIFFIYNCQSVVKSYILLDTNYSIQKPTDNNIWLKGNEYYPWPYLPIVRCEDGFKAVIHHNECFKNYFDYSPNEKISENVEIQEKRKEYMKYFDLIADELWDAFINKKFEHGEYKDRGVLFINK